jgi:type IV fimbrial biogenesis protein FimT
MNNKVLPNAQVTNLQNKQPGFSLIEMLIVMSILATLAVLSLMQLRTWLTQLEQDLALDRIKHAIEFAKNEAFRSGKTISLCPSADHKFCYIKDDWSTGFIIFENPDRDTQPKPNSILKIVQGAQYGKIFFDALGNELHIRPNGTTTNIGKFYYCAKNLAHSVDAPFTQSIRMLVINWVVRGYFIQEENSIRCRR